MKKFSLFLAAGIILTASLAFAQENGMESGVSQERMSAALEELSGVYGSPVVRPDQARAICNEEQYMIECAEIGKKYGLYPKEREREVDTLLGQFKGKIVENLKQCGSTECLIGIANQIARELGARNPTLAREVDLTLQKVGEKQSIVDTAKSVGVDIEECRAMDPDSASVELLRGCARLARDERIARHIPEADRGRVEKSESTADLKEALESGEFACGDGTIEGCGTFCLNPSASAREQGIAAIPPVCRQIAQRFFGGDGISELERAYRNVRSTYDDAKNIYMEREDNFYQRNEEGNEGREVGSRGTTTPQRIQCPTIEYSECPSGEYRQESVSEFGCFTKSECIPFNTKTMAEQDKENMRVVCPAMPTVDSCSESEERIVDFSSPECGTYYVCRPKVEDQANIKYPYAFRSGRVALSFDEARIYCYESGRNGATVRGDKEECMRVFGISVPDIPPEKQHCEDWGTGWHNMDESGNCFNPSMTEYRTPGGTLQACASVSVYGCSSSKGDYEPPSGQKEQLWNSLGLRSWVLSKASEVRIAELKSACAMTPSNANVWLPEAGRAESTDFGMPDPGKCAKAAACGASQYFNGSECKDIGQSQWCSGNQYWNGNSCVPIPSVTPTTGTTTGSGGTGTGTATSSYQGDANSCPGFAYSRWDSRGARYCQLNSRVSCQYFYPQYLSESNYTSSGCPAGDSTTGGGGVSGSCSSEVTALLGTGCHSMGNAWFDSAMTSYVLPGSTMLKSCTSDWLSGCSGSGSGGTGASGQREQVWNSLGLRSWVRNDADSARVESLKQRCANVLSSSNVWMPSAGDYASAGFGMPSPDKCDTASACPSGQYFNGSSCSSSVSGGSGSSCGSGQYWNGSACVSSTSGGGSTGGTSSMSRCFYPNATINGTPPGYTVWCESDYYNCHVGEPSGASVSTSGLALGAPSTCDSGWSGGSTGGSTTGSECRRQSSQSACSAVSGCYWYTGYSGNYCDSSGSSASSGGSGSSCSSNQYWNGSACVSSDSTSGASSCPSGQYWSGSACMSSTGSYGSGSGSSCGSNQYWDTRTNSCQSMQSACSEAGGTWDSSANYCRMTTSSAGTGPVLAFLCPAGHDWNGSFCTREERSGMEQLLANALAAFKSLFAR